MKKMLVSWLVAALSVAAPTLALAQSDYYDDSYYTDDYNVEDYNWEYDYADDYNYDNYDYDYEGSGAGLAALGVGMMVLFGVLSLVGLVALIFTIWMIVDAAKRDFDQKALWIILMVFFGWIAALVYYFMIKRKNITRAHPKSAPPVAK